MNFTYIKDYIYFLKFQILIFLKFIWFMNYSVVSELPFSLLFIICWIIFNPSFSKSSNYNLDYEIYSSQDVCLMYTLHLCSVWSWCEEVSNAEFSDIFRINLFPNIEDYLISNYILIKENHNQSRILELFFLNCIRIIFNWVVEIPSGKRKE